MAPKSWTPTSEGFAYYTTMPTDALTLFERAAVETEKVGFDKVKELAWKLGNEAAR